MANNKKPPATLQDVVERFKEFVAFINRVTTPGEQGRTMFPDFFLTETIRNKLIEIRDLVKNDRVHEAGVRLMETEQHFQNQVAAYARRLLKINPEKGWYEPGLVEDIEDLIGSSCPDTLIKPVKEALRRYEECVTQKFFDLEHASVLYWEADGQLQNATALWEKQQEDERRRKAQAKAEADRVREEEAVQRRLERCEKAADELSALIPS